MATIFQAPVHAGWQTDTGTDGLALWHAMGYRDDELLGAPLPMLPHANGTADDKETEAVVCRAFKRNLQSRHESSSQYGYDHVTWKSAAMSCLVEEALGTAKAKELLRQEAYQAASQLAQSHPVAVWRRWPHIERCPHTKRLQLYMRLHVMTEAAYQSFVQEKQTG